MAEFRLTLLAPSNSLEVVPGPGDAGTLLARMGVVLRGESGATSRRHAYAVPDSYAATAPAGTLDSAATWTIARITVAADGSTATATATGAWTDRTALTYV